MTIIEQSIQNPAGFGDIAALLESADALARELGYPDPALRAAYHRQVLMLLSQGYAQVFGTQVEHPDWVPHTGPLFPWGAPNHDTIYGFAPIDAKGTYRISGNQGTESIASLMFRKGGANTGQIHGATLGEIDVQAIETGADRRFSLLLCAERPSGYRGPWFTIPPEATGLTARHVTETPEQYDGAWSIERLDRSPADSSLSAAEIGARMALLISFVGRLNGFLLRLVRKLRDDGYTNRFLADRFAGNGGIAAQMYFQSLFEFDDDEVLVLEAQMPESVNYWSVQLVDPFYSAIDFTFHSSAFNGSQAVVGSDGRARFVVSAEDPGVPNWLDTAGWRRGGMFWRWHKASSFPEPNVSRIKRAVLRDYLPADTPTVDATQRGVERARRISQYQRRRRW